MACSCHGKSGENLQNKRMPPDSQCLMCAMKHIGMAMEAMHELAYERDNRDFALAHIRLAMEHTKLQWRNVAVMMRDVAIDIELVRDKTPMQIHDELLAVRNELRRLYDIEHPEQAARLRELRNGIKTDIIIPLGNGSRHDNMELRILLRSIAKHCTDVGRVFLATKYCPKWVNRYSVEVVEIPDTEEHNKDANLIDKVLSVIQMHSVERFCFCADDNAFMQECELKHIPILHGRSRASFQPADTKWRRRTIHTFEYFDRREVSVENTFDIHAPQFFEDAQKLLRMMRDVDYRSDPGLTIMTAFRCSRGEIYGSFPVSEFKLTFERNDKAALDKMSDDELCSRLFVGYNDDGVNAGILDRLKAIFSERCKYEQGV